MYFDTTCWIRTIETVSGSLLNEKNAIIDILDLKEQNPSQYEIVSCKTQLHQLYTKKNSGNTSAAMKEALVVAIAQLEIHAEHTITNDPFNVIQKRNELQQLISLPDNEDAKHIVTAWIHQADYFITVDWRSILNFNTGHIIENALRSMVHPIQGIIGLNMTIIDPISLLAIL